MALGTVHKMGFAALIMAASVFVSRLMGLLRDKVISWQFGAGAETDIYFTAFVIPDFINHLLAGGYIAITLIPLLSKRFEEDVDDGWRFFSAVFWWSVIGITCLTAIAFMFAPQLSSLAAPGFKPDEQARLTHFLRIILPAQMFFLPGACVSALLYIRRQFWTPALTPIVYNGCIILGGVMLADRGMEGFCWGVLIGAALGAFVLPVMVARYGYGSSSEEGRVGLSIQMTLRHPLLKRLLLLALPLILGLSVTVMDEQFVRIFGSMAGEGAVSLLSYARRIMLVPVGVVAQAAGVASFPFLAALLAKGDEKGFESTLNTAFRGSLLVVFPLTAYMVIAAGPTLGFLFEGGRFSAEDTRMATPLLQILLLSVPYWVVQQVTGRAFYARQDTLTPALVGTLVTLVAVPLYFMTVARWGAMGVACMTTGCLLVYAKILGLVWMMRHGGGAFSGLVRISIRCLSLCVPGSVAGWLLVERMPGWCALWIPQMVQQTPALVHLLTLGISAAVFGLIYAGLAWFLLPEAIPLLKRRQG